MNAAAENFKEVATATGVHMGMRRGYHRVSIRRYGMTLLEMKALRDYDGVNLLLPEQEILLIRYAKHLRARETKRLTDREYDKAYARAGSCDTAHEPLSRQEEIIATFKEYYPRDYALSVPFLDTVPPAI